MITRRLIRPSLSKLNQNEPPAEEHDAPEPPRDERDLDAPPRDSRYGGGYNRGDERRPYDRGGYNDRPSYGGDRPSYGDRGGFAPRGPGGSGAPRFRPGGFSPKPGFKKKKFGPPSETNAENYYYKKQMEKKTPVVAVLRDGEQIKGWIEWYDRDVLKINRDAGPNLLVYKSNLKYLYKDEEKIAELEAQRIARGEPAEGAAPEGHGGRDEAPEGDHEQE